MFQPSSILFFIPLCRRTLAETYINTGYEDPPFLVNYTTSKYDKYLSIWFLILSSES